jgi:hypothetical protein
MNPRFVLWLLICNRRESRSEPERIPTWLVFLAYLAYLRAMRPQQPPEARVLHSLIVVIGLVLVVVALVAAGAPENVGEAIQNWPIIP